MAKSLIESIGNTPLVDVALDSQNVILGKLEGNNPGGSVKDRAALRMIEDAERENLIKNGDTLIEATSGNTGIALAMVSSMKGYKIKLIMPETASVERVKIMKAYGADVILVSKEADMEGARDLAIKMQNSGEGVVLDQFSNKSNILAHYEGTGPEIWEQTQGKVTHFISSMGTTGTITGVSKYLKEMNSSIIIIGAQPTGDSKIPGIRRWKSGYEPEIKKEALIDYTLDVSRDDAEKFSRQLSKQKGLFCGLSAAANVFLAHQISKNYENAIIVTIICDRGDRYLSLI